MGATTHACVVQAESSRSVVVGQNDVDSGGEPRYIETGSLLRLPITSWGLGTSRRGPLLTGENLKEPCQQIVAKFEERCGHLGRLDKGILLREGLAFCAKASSLHIDMIVESGVCNGYSTSIWASFFPEVPVIAIDLVLYDKTREHLGQYPNVELREGNGARLVPALVAKHHRRKIAVFIDGPKRSRAVRLAGHCLEERAVCLVGIHDVRCGSAGRQKMDGWGRARFYTDEPWFVDEYAYLDQYVGRPPVVGLAW